MWARRHRVILRYRYPLDLAGGRLSPDPKSAEIKNGKIAVPDAPGLGVELAGNRYKRHMRPINVCLAVRVRRRSDAVPDPRLDL